MLDINKIKDLYFLCDESVPYKLNNKTIFIHPISLRHSVLYDKNVGILNIEKNETNNVDIIKMSYIEYLYWLIQYDDKCRLCLDYIFSECLKIDSWSFGKDDNDKMVIIDHTHNCVIKQKNFDEIKTIILYQNNINYDDKYISPEIKDMMIKVDSIKSSGREVPCLERKIAIVSAHTGITKEQQLNMTYRSHQFLFQEIVGEVEFTTTRPVALFYGQAKQMEHWLFPRKKNKMENYFVTVGTYKQSFGGDSSMSSSTGNGVDALLLQNNL